MGNVKDTQFVQQKRTNWKKTNSQNKQKQASRNTKNVHGIVWNGGCLYYSDLPNLSPTDVKSDHFEKGTGKDKIHGNFFNKEVEKLDDHGCPKLLDIFDPEEMWICSSYSYRH